MSKTTLERIHDYMYSMNSSQNITLTEVEQGRLDRARAAWELRLKLFTKSEVATRIETTFGVKRTTAFKDIDFSERLFTDPSKNHKKAQRTILSEVCLRRARLAEERGEDKIMQKWMDLYGKYNLLDKDDPIVPNKDQLKIADIVTGIDPRLERALVQLLDKAGPTDITSIFDKAQAIEIEDVEFEELPTIGKSK